jgi:aminoglycoside 6'-N-acetyltransferase
MIAASCLVRDAPAGTTLPGQSSSPVPGVELRGERVTLRPLEEADVPRLAEIAAEPEVAHWWLGLSEEDLLDKVGPAEDGLVFAVEHDGELIGLAQADEEADPDYRHAGIDLFLGSAWHGRGLGADTVRTLARYLLEDRGHHRLTIDPAAANERAIRCYESVGFRRVGLMRAYERGSDGSWHDGLLLELLSGELR